MKNSSCFNPLDREYVLISESELLEATTNVPSSCIVVASSLSNMLVVKCIKYQVRAILTKQCNFTSHAANILRAANTKRQIIDWIYGIDIEQISNYIGMNALFDGVQLRIKGVTCPFMLKTAKREYGESTNQAQASLNLSNKHIRHCYYPTTHFSAFAFSLMKTSLEKELNTYFSAIPNINLVDGVLEFENSPSLSEINDFACNVLLAEKYYMDMLENYSRIVELLRFNSWDFSSLCQAAEMYYSTFIVLHRSYDMLFRNMSRKLNDEIAQCAQRICNEIMQSMIDLWLSSEDNVLINKKVFLQDEPVAKIPCFTVSDDVNDSIKRVKGAFLDLRLEEYYTNNEKWLKLHSIIFVLKEWKFVIYKIIFTHIKVIIEKSGILANIDKKKIASMTKGEVAELL